MLFPSIQAITLEKRQATLVLFHLIWASEFLKHSSFHSISTSPKHDIQQHWPKGTDEGWGWGVGNEH